MIGLFRFLLGWYAAWLVVGLGLAFYHLYQGPGSYLLIVSPAGHVEDFVFLALAAGLLGMWLGMRVGGARAWAMFAWVAAVSGLVESFGLNHDWPFGIYSYTGRLGPELPNGLPLAVPLAWWVVVMPVYLAAQLILELMFVRKRSAVNTNEAAASPWPGRLLAVATAMGCVATDIGLEPAASRVRFYWNWDSAGSRWYGVPMENFLGWAGVSFILALGLQAMAGRALRGQFRPGGAQMLLPMLLPATILAPFWIDLTGLAGATAWVSLLLILWMGQAMLWTRLRPPAWGRALWAGPPRGGEAHSPETNR